jgi:uncharacterized SAM-binding protein YcdF (DUF218 family)
MKPSAGGKFRRILAVVLLALLALVALGAYALIHLGTFLAREDLLTRGDAIFVLAGTEMTRPLEGADLYLQGYAPRLVMSREVLEPAFAIIERRGAPLSSKVERARDVLINLGVPATAVVLPDRIHGSTAAEAITLREMAQTNHWRTVIVVTSKFHLRRAGFAIRRELRGTGVRVLMRGSRYDNARPEQWWRQRGDLRDILEEVPKFAAYALGLGA